jgi:hypothetical protein
MSHLFHILRFINSATFVVQCNNPIYAVFLILAFFNASVGTFIRS